MNTAVRFILNNEDTIIDINPAIVLLDFLRYSGYTGTKEGCKEGDCGACTVLCGSLVNDEVVYKPMNSCLIPMMNIAGKHIVTIEGLNQNDNLLSPIQKAFVDEGASQCGFCTPGFIVSLTAFFLNESRNSNLNAVDFLDGNICRCTGHNSIIRAARKVEDDFKYSLNGKNRIDYLIGKEIIPEYFKGIRKRLLSLNNFKINNPDLSESTHFIGGGTDIFVQKPSEALSANNYFLFVNTNLKHIFKKDGYCYVGSSVTVNDLLESELLRSVYPDIENFCKLFGSTPIRNNATAGGNIVNASPIGDMTALFLALNSDVILFDGKIERKIPLNKFFISYKKTQRKPFEYLKYIRFKIPEGNYYINYEKVSKRTYLDIASVNTAIFIETEHDLIKSIVISAGGVSEIPKILNSACGFLTGKEINIFNLKEAVSIAEKEISPISDARGSADYKRLLLSRLILAHFIKLFPESVNISETV